MKEGHPVFTNPLLDLLTKPARLVFIVNPNSGTKLQANLTQHIDRHLNHRKFIYSIWHTERPGHATELAARAVEEGFEIVVAVGGDGSINEVAAGLLHTDTALGIIPAGSGNGLSMHLGYGRDIASAIKKLNTARIHEMDCGMVNGRPFVNVAGIGFDGLVSNLMQGQTKRGLIPYFIKSIQAGLDYTPKSCVLVADGREIKENCFAVSVANGPMFGYNVSIAPDARMDDGLFSVVILKQAPRWQYFMAVKSALTGKIFEENFVEHFTTSSLKIYSEGENYIHLDGEGVKHNGVLEFEMLPKALKMLAPQGSVYEERAVD